MLRGTFIPTVRWNSKYLLTLVSILGGNISPYLFFWVADQEVEEQVSQGRKQLRQRRGASDSELTYAAWDCNLGMFFSSAVIYFINLATAATLFKAGKSAGGNHRGPDVCGCHCTGPDLGQVEAAAKEISPDAAENPVRADW